MIFLDNVYGAGCRLNPYDGESKYVEFGLFIEPINDDNEGESDV